MRIALLSHTSEPWTSLAIPVHSNESRADALGSAWIDGDNFADSDNVTDDAAVAASGGVFTGVGARLVTRSTRPPSSGDLSLTSGSNAQIQTITHKDPGATQPPSYSEYVISYGGFIATAPTCIGWNATAEAVRVSIQEAVDASGHGAPEGSLAVEVRRFGEGLAASPWGHTFEVRFFGSTPIGVRRPLQLSVDYDATELNCAIALASPNATLSEKPKVVSRIAIESDMNARTWPGYTSLKENSTYTVDVRSVSVEGGMSDSMVPAGAVTVTTPSIGFVPAQPVGVFANNLGTGTEIEVFFSEPDTDGGEPITKYLVEWDSNSMFSTRSATYGSRAIELLPEVQVIETSFASSTGRGGYWTM